MMNKLTETLALHIWIRYVWGEQLQELVTEISMRMRNESMEDTQGHTAHTGKRIPNTGKYLSRSGG